MRGGKRSGSGRKPKPKLIKTLATKCIATEVLESLGDKKFKHADDCGCEICRWRDLVLAKGFDRRLGFDVLKYLTDRRDGKPLQLVQGKMQHTGEDGGPIEFRDTTNTDLNERINQLERELGYAAPAEARGAGQAEARADKTRKAHEAR